MRFLLSLIAILILINLAVFLWPNNKVNAPHVYAAKKDFNPHFLRLNKEVEEKHYKVTKSTTNASAGEVTGSCYRLGPFLHESNYELAQAVLFNANVDFEKSKRVSKESEVYRIYLGPYQNEAQISDARVDLKRSNVLDHFVRKLDSQDFIISLGIFTTEESANDALGLFGDKLEKVKMKQEQLVLPDSFWLHFTIFENDQIKQQLRQMDWGEQSVKLGKHQCGEV